MISILEFIPKGNPKAQPSLSTNIAKKGTKARILNPKVAEKGVERRRKFRSRYIPRRLAPGKMGHKVPAIYRRRPIRPK